MQTLSGSRLVYDALVGLPAERIAEVVARFPGAAIHRYGGLMRVAAGDPLKRGGQIVAVLQDGASFSPSALASAGQAFGQLATAFSGVAAVTGVLNLGVSAVGFAVMNKKLNRLQAGLEEFRSFADKRLTSIDDALERTEERLVDLGLLASETLGGVDDLKVELSEVSRLLDLNQYVKLTRVIERLEEGSYPRDRADRARDDLIELRHFFAGAIVGQIPTRVGPRLVRDLAYFQTWALAVATEARLLRSMGDTARSKAVLEQQVQTLAATAIPYARMLLGGCPADFVSPIVDGFVPSDVFARWMMHTEPESTERSTTEIIQHAISARDEKLRATGVSSSRYVAGLSGPGLKNRAVAIERLLTTVERLETYRVEMDMCSVRGLTADQWEARKHDGESAVSLYLTPVREAA